MVVPVSELGKSYLYFFSYWGRGDLEEDDQGFGNAVLVLPNRLDDQFEVHAIEQHLRETLGLPAVVLISFQFLRTIRREEIVHGEGTATDEVARQLFRRLDDEN